MIVKMAPSAEEAALVATYDGDVELLGGVERFFKAAGLARRFRPRLEAAHTSLQFDEVLTGVEERVETFEAMYNALQARRRRRRRRYVVYRMISFSPSSAPASSSFSPWAVSSVYVVVGVVVDVVGAVVIDVVGVVVVDVVGVVVDVVSVVVDVVGVVVGVVGVVRHAFVPTPRLFLAPTAPRR